MELVQFAEWAAPIVTVLKSDKKTVRILCGNFSQTVNKAAKLDAYPLPKIRDKSSWSKEVFNIGPKPSVSASATGRAIEKVCSDQYPQRAVPVQSLAIWHLICTRG